MNLIKKLKTNRFVRGLYLFVIKWFGYRKGKYGYCASDVTMTPPIFISNPRNVFLMGNNGLNNACILTTNARFFMKPNSGAASGLTVVTGNHLRKVGVFYRNITEKDKPPGFDKDVVVESDVWIGVNVTLLSGVVIGRGTTVAAGAVVNKSLPPYCICAGVPAKVIKVYWTIDQILEHEAKLYPYNERYSREELKAMLAAYL